MIRIVCVGKLKEIYLSDACDEYIKRIRKYSKIEIIELKDTDIDKEKEAILKNINLKDYIITLDIEGNMLNSKQLSEKIDNVFLTNSDITFIIGGSTGLHQEIKKLAKYSLSFSKLTFPHQLFRVMLLEQIYRSFKIMNNETYHK